MTEAPAARSGVHEPTAAQQLLSIVAAAGSLTLSGSGYRRELVGTRILDCAGRLTLRMPADDPLAARVVGAPGRTLATLAEFTDVAPVAVRQRVRARVRLSGRLVAEAAQAGAAAVTLRMPPTRAMITTPTGCHTVALDDLAAIRPDPLATREADILMHLADRHPEAVARLARLVEHRLLQGVVRVWPLALDRFGIILRLEHARTHRDVRLAFHSPVREPSEVTDRMRVLLDQARCPRRHRPHARP